MDLRKQVVHDEEIAALVAKLDEIQSTNDPQEPDDEDQDQATEK